MEGIDFLYCNICLSEKGESKKLKQLSRHLKDKHDISTYLYKTLFLNSPTVCIETHSKISENNGMKKPDVAKRNGRARKGKSRSFSPPWKGMTFEEYYESIKESKEKAKLWKQRLSESKCKRGTYEQRFGKRTADTMKEMLSDNFTTNNPAFNPVALLKRAETQKRMYAIGELVHPFKGKTKDNLPFLIRTPEIREKISIANTDWEFYYKHGTTRTNYPYAKTFNTQLKESIAKRDNYTCQKCNTKFPRYSSIHHIDYDKMNSKPINLIFLCRSCHSKLHSIIPANREYWKSYFIAYQKERESNF